MAFLYLTSRGWKTGRPHEVEIWYVKLEGRFYLVSELGERSHWVQNIRRNPEVSFRVEGRTYRGKGRVVDEASEPELAGRISGLMQESYRWSDGLIVELAPA